jgi:fringe protein
MIQEKTSKSIRIMYVIRTSSHFYQKRLIYLLQTWIPLVNNDVFFVTDIFLPNISKDHIILTKKTCGSDAHSMNILCCKTAHDFILFHRHISKYNWFCHFDDDQYVNVNNLNEYLSTFDSDQPYYIGRTSWADTLKRTKEPFPQPFWFATLGAGVCLSKRAIKLLKTYTQSPSEFADGCIRENYHDDIYLGFVLSGYLNISVTKTNHFHSHLEKDFYSDKQTFLKTYTDQITFGFRSPDRYPYYLPQLYTSHTDPYHIRTLHCYLYTQLDQCQIKIQQQLFNSTI